VAKRIKEEASLRKLLSTSAAEILFSDVHYPPGCTTVLEPGLAKVIADLKDENLLSEGFVDELFDDLSSGKREMIPGDTSAAYWAPMEDGEKPSQKPNFVPEIVAVAKQEVEAELAFREKGLDLLTNKFDSLEDRYQRGVHEMNRDCDKKFIQILLDEDYED